MTLLGGNEAVASVAHDGPSTATSGMPGRGARASASMRRRTGTARSPSCMASRLRMAWSASTTATGADRRCAGVLPADRAPRPRLGSSSPRSSSWPSSVVGHYLSGSPAGRTGSAAPGLRPGSAAVERGRAAAGRRRVVRRHQRQVQLPASTDASQLRRLRRDSSVMRPVLAAGLRRRRRRRCGLRLTRLRHRGLVDEQHLAFWYMYRAVLRRHDAVDGPAQPDRRAARLRRRPRRRHRRSRSSA